MKKGIFYSLLLMLSFSLMSSTCSSSDDEGQNPNDNSVVIAEVTSSVVTGTWRITSFINSANDETNNFNAFNFTFSGNGMLVAENGSTSINGNWSLTDTGDSNDDTSNIDEIDFNIAFSSPDDFTELSEDWHIVSRTITKIELIHVSGGNGGTDTLTFEMN